MNFELSKSQIEKYKEFCKNHKECLFTSTIGGKITISFTPTGLGNIIHLKCEECGQEIDITECDNW